MENDPEYQIFLKQLGQMNDERILQALAEAKTGSKDFHSYMSLAVHYMATGALVAFIKALEAHNADKLIDGSLK